MRTLLLLFASGAFSCKKEPAEQRTHDGGAGVDATDTGTAAPDSTFPQTSGWVTPPCAEIPLVAAEVLSTLCGDCHSEGSPEFGGFDAIGDAYELVNEGWVAPGEPNASPVFLRMVTDEMPPSAARSATPEEKGVVEQWIGCGAEPWMAPRDRVSAEAEIQAANADAKRLFDPRTARYLSLVPLYNAGVPSDRILLFAGALTKLAASLTSEPGVRPLDPILLDHLALEDGTVLEIADDLGASLLFRVDLQHLGWGAGDQTADGWEELLKVYPFGIPADGRIPAAVELVERTGSRVPIVHGDWFVAKAATPPLYFDLLDIPESRDGFLQRFGGIWDLQTEFDQNRADCAGLAGTSSAIALFNRAACRHTTDVGYCWQTFDFATESGTSYLFAHPTGFLTNHDGGSILCSLPSGQQVYGVFDGEGRRLDEAPATILWDNSGAVTTGVSCMRCHHRGIVEVADEVLDVVLAAPSDYPDAVFDQVLAWYPLPAVQADLQAADIALFEASLAALELDTGEEPISALSSAYTSDPNAARVAADLGLEELDLMARIAADDTIGVHYLPLEASGGTIGRELFEEIARDTICAWELGGPCNEATFCGLSAVPCPSGALCDRHGQCSPAH